MHLLTTAAHNNHIEKVFNYKAFEDRIICSDSREEINFLLTKN